jgi:ribonuclease Z
LLHEATFSDEDLDLGLKKMHSTVGEACYVARQVGARRTLLTHFSQRYNSVNRGKSSWLLEDGYRVMAAVDGLWIKLSEYRNSFSCQRPFEAVKARACVEAP